MPEKDTATDDAETPSRDLSPVALDFLKFFGIAGIAGLFLAGYSYADTFYDRFGLALHEVGIGYLETIEFAAYLLGEDFVVLVAVAVALLSSGAVAWVRYSFSDFGFYLSVAIIFLLLSYFAVYGGSTMANSYANGVIRGDEGRLCQLAPKGMFTTNFRETFKLATQECRVRKIKETKEMMYLYVIPITPSEGQERPDKSLCPDEQQPTRQQREAPDHGTSLGIQKDHLTHCRIASGGGKSN